MPDLACQEDGNILNVDTRTWGHARDAFSGVLRRTNTQVAQAAWAEIAAGRGGTINRVYRSFFEFDTSGISEEPSAATLKLYGISQNSADTFIVKGTQTATLIGGDFDAIDGWASSGDNEGNVTKYSAELTSWTINGYNNITMTSDALADIASEDRFLCVFLESAHDLRDVSSGTFSLLNGVAFKEGIASVRPILSYTEAVSGYTHDVSGVASANIGKISGVADIPQSVTANVGKVIGVD